MPGGKQLSLVILLALFPVILQLVLNAQRTQADLNSLRLSPHADLPQNQHYGRNLRTALSDTRTLSGAKDNPSKGLSLIVSDGLQEMTATADFSIARLYSALTCRADAIVIGRINGLMSRLTTSGTGIYTDYSFLPEAIFRSNGSLGLDKPIIITKPGGQIDLPEGRISLDDRQYPKLDPGRSYLLFLKLIAATGSFQLVDVWSTLVNYVGRWQVARRVNSNVPTPFGDLDSTEQLVEKWSSDCSLAGRLSK